MTLFQNVASASYHFFKNRSSCPPLSGVPALTSLTREDDSIQFDFDQDDDPMEYWVQSEVEEEGATVIESVESRETTVSFDLNSSQRLILNQTQSEDGISVTPPPSFLTRSPSRSQTPEEQSILHPATARRIGGTLRGRGRGRGGRRARAPSTLAGRFIENRAEMEGNFLSDQHRVKLEILSLEKEAALIYKTTLQEKAHQEQQHLDRKGQQAIDLFNIEREKATNLARLEVIAAKFRVRREEALTMKAEKEAGLSHKNNFDNYLTM